MLNDASDDKQCFQCDMALNCHVPFKKLFDHAEESMWILQGNRFISANQAACREFGIRDVTEFIGLHPSQISPVVQPDGTSSAAKANAYMTSASTKGYCRFEWMHQRLDGNTVPMEITLTAIHFAGEPALFAVGRDISHFKETQKKLHHLANHDPLTGLGNRRNFEKSIICEITQNKIDNRGFAILFIDLDNFKVINDGLGHTVGDALLTSVAERMKQQLSGFACELFRLGGDEFVVLCRKQQALDQTENIAKSIIQVFEQPFDVRNKSLHITSSIGITRYPEHGTSYGELLKNADAAMYKSKALGKNQYMLFDDNIALQAEVRLMLEQELRRALLEQHFEIHYQPIFSVNGKLKAAEALVRWKHPTKGMIAPDHFIPIAESTGLIIPLGRWVQQTVCGDITELMQAHEDLAYISINVSIHELKESHFLSDLRQCCQDCNVAPHKVMLEITETTLFEEIETFSGILHEIRGCGFGLSVDDFGTGYSSLQYLKALPVTQLKLDRSFITGLANNHHDTAIVQAIVTLAEALGLDTLAEGIEDEETKLILRAIGCRNVQGFLFSKPLPKLAFFQFLNKCPTGS